MTHEHHLAGASVAMFSAFTAFVETAGSLAFRLVAAAMFALVTGVFSTIGMHWAKKIIDRKS